MAVETENVLAESFQQLGQTEDASLQDNTTETLDAANDLDYDDADHPLSDLSGFNINAITKNNVTTQGLEDFKTTYADNQVTTDNTTLPPKKLSIADLDNLGKKQIADQKNQAKIAGAQFEATSRNPYMSYKSYEFDQYTTKVDRYRGYGATTFNRLGFNPMEDNEEYYNANTSGWQDFKRMSGQYGDLFSTAFTSNYKTFGDWISGKENLLDADEELDDQMARANELGMSSKKGIGAFATNLSLQTAYTVGILANIAAEEAVIALGAAGLSMTGNVPAAVALEAAEQVRTADKLRKLYQGWKAGMVGVKSVGQMFKGGYQMVKSLRYANDAREFWTAARAGGAMFGRGALNFINPLEGTADVVRGIRAGEVGYKNLTNMAKASRTFGAFYRDVRNGWFSIGESKMEGGGVYNDIVRDEIKIYQEANNGEFPPQEELDKIYKRAEDGGRLNTIINLPMLFLSNKLVLDNIFSFRGTAGVLNAAEQFGIKGVGKNFVWNLGERTFTENSLGYLKNLGKAALSPKTYIAGALNYTKANLMEAVQELGQETSSGAIKEYYHNTYMDPSLGGSDYVKSMVYSSLGKNVFSKQGIETFASGFLMGGMTSVGGKVLKSGLTGSSELFMKKFSPEKYDAYVKNKQQAKTIVINAMNTIMADPNKFFSRTKESAVNQKKVSQNLSEASINNDDYAFYNAKDEQAFDHIFTVLDAGSFGQMVGALKSFSTLSDKDLADAFNVEDGIKAREKLNEYLGRAGQIKEKYDYFQKKFPNPFDPKRFEKGSEEQIREFIAYKGFEDAKKAAVASQYGFERATQRMTGVFNDLQKNPAIRKSSATDYTVLQSKENIVNEIKILQDEVAGLKQGGAEEKKLARKKEKKLEALEEYLGNLDVYETEKEKSTVTPDGKLVSPSNKKLLSPLSKSFKKYIKTLAELNGEEYVFDDNIKSAFEKISDYYKLSDDAKSYTNVVNKLVNPEELVRYAEVIDKSLMEIYNDRNNYLTESVKNYVNIFELNALMTALGKMGVIISPDQIDDMVKKGEMPNIFFDLFKNVIIDENDPRYPDIIEKVQIYTKLKKEDGIVQEEEVKPAEATPPTQATPAQPTAATFTPTTPYGTATGPEVVTQTPTSQPALPTDLLTLLKAAYDEFMQNNLQSSMTFNDYVNTSARAAGIKKEYEDKNKGNQQPAPAAQPAAPAPPAPAAPTITPVAAPVIPAAPLPPKAPDEETRLANLTGVANRAYYKAVFESIGLSNTTEQSAQEFFKSNFYKKNKDYIDDGIKTWKLEKKNLVSFELIPTYNEGKGAIQISVRDKTTPGTLYSMGNVAIELTDELTALGKETEKTSKDFYAYFENNKNKPSEATVSKVYDEKQLQNYFENSNTTNYYYKAEKELKSEAKKPLFGKAKEPTKEEIKARAYELFKQRVESIPSVGNGIGVVVHGTLDGFNRLLNDGVSERDIIIPKDARSSDNKEGNELVKPNGDRVLSVTAPMYDNFNRIGGAVYEFIVPNNSNAEVSEINRIVKEAHENLVFNSKDAEGKRAAVKEVVSKVKEYINSSKEGTTGKEQTQPSTTPSAQANPKNIGVNTDVVVVENQSERPDVFDQWTDLKIVSSAQPMLIAENIDRLFNIGQKLDKDNAPWSIGSFRAQVDGRLIVDVFAGGEHFLVYKSTGEGTGAESKGEWVPILGFAQNGWFIKTMWKGENPKFTKYESKTFKAIDSWLKTNSDSLFNGPEVSGPTEIQLAAETNVVQPVEQVKTAKEIAKEIFDSATSLRGFPNPKLEGKSKVAQDLIALLSDVDADISPKDVADMYQVRKKELKENIKLSDFQKGDLVTFTNGDKGFVNTIGTSGISVKIIGSAPGEYREYLLSGRDPIMGDVNLRNSVDMIEEKKAVPVEQTEKVEIDALDKKEVEISKNTLAEFSSDPAKIKAAMEEIKSQTSTSNQNNTNNLLNNLGCKTNI